jgi:type III pantothenate kinase
MGNEMLLAIDIGNTDTTLGVFDGEELSYTWHMATGFRRMADEYAVLLISLLRQQNISPPDIKTVVMCSVVPPLVSTLTDLFKRYFHVTPMVIGAGIKTKVRIRMDNPREVGADRIVNAVAAHHLYSGAVIVIDLGTATTFDVISSEGDYLGGAIAPGVMSAAEALFTRAAMLPRVELARPKNAIGTNTAMQSGILFGYVGLIEGMVARLRKELGEEAKVVATGGLARLIAQETKVISEVNPSLTLEGLRLVYLMNKS